ncbi:MAG: UbiA family prenyltransferase [Burkholderiaceae bacterium]|nr:UbiA family prenyltransferase [Burkholderiaceae bacterium]
MNPIPLAVDLDGTLVQTDTLHEAALRALRERPLALLQLPFWLLQGRAEVKQRLAGLSRFDPAALPYNQQLLDWLATQRAQGRRLVLCTAADRSIADAVASHLGIFDEVLASDGRTNLGGQQKAEALERRFGAGGFDYAGNARTDLKVWRRARRAVVVNAAPAVQRAARECCDIDTSFAPHAPDLGTLARVLRVHQWMKNLLLFMAPMAAHIVPDAGLATRLLLAFLAFSLCASTVYVANDLFDLDSDRHHPRKRRRPFAAGRVPVAWGVIAAPFLLAAGFLLALPVGSAFLGWLAVYFVVTCAYSWGLKRLVIVDCLVLALLYALRIIAGAAAAGIPMSFWLLAFSAFLFLSLAFVKRYAELDVQASIGRERAHGRGYLTADAPLVQSLGIMSGYSAVVVLALYLNSDAVLRLYRSPEFMWCAVPVMLFWISWIWMKAHRGQMHDDPLLFAVRDRASLAAGAAFVAVLLLGSRGWTW